MTNAEIIKDCLREGADHAVSRAALREWTGFDDRTVRDAIADLKMEIPVINVGGGYFIPTEEDAEEIKTYYRAQQSREVSIRKSLKSLEPLYVSVTANPDQLEVENG